MKFNVLAIGLLVTLAYGCRNEKTDMRNGAEASAQPEEEKAPVEAEMGNEMAFLTNNSYGENPASSFEIIVEDCATGYTTILTQAQPKGELYAKDKGCLGKLTKFSFEGEDYLPSAEDPFTDYKVGDTALFVSTTNAENTLYVTVASQINMSGGHPGEEYPSDPYLTDLGWGKTHKVKYVFKGIKKGNDVVVKPERDKVNGQVVGKAIPYFKVKQGEVIKIADNGAGKFVFKLECNEKLKGWNADAVCIDVKLTNISYVLVQDIYEGELTLQEAKALFDGSQKQVTPADIIPPGAYWLSNGGFKTSVLEGPAQMHLNPDMLLVISNGNETFQYFSVKVETLP